MGLLRGFRVGSVAGFPIRVNLSFLIFLGVVFVAMGGASGLAVALMAAGSVLLHELGHAFMARHLGVPIVGIELHFFGGAAQMAGEPRRPEDEIAIAVAGPAVSFALAAIGHVMAAATGVHAFAIFGWVNTMLAVFNLLPAFPSDGGRVLRAFLARRRGRVSATEIAVKVGRVICVALGITGIAIGSFQLVLVAGVLWMMGSAERFSARMRGDSGAWRGTDAPVYVEYIAPGAPLSPPVAPFVASPATFRGQRWPSGRVVFVWRS